MNLSIFLIFIVWVHLQTTTANVPLTKTPDVNSTTTVTPVSKSADVHATKANAPITESPDVYSTEANSPITESPDVYSTAANAPITESPDVYSTEAIAPVTESPDVYSTEANAPVTESSVNLPSDKTPAVDSTEFVNGSISTISIEIIGLINGKLSWVQDQVHLTLLRDYMIFCPNQDMCLGEEIRNNVNISKKQACTTCSCSDECFKTYNCCPSKDLENIRSMIERNTGERLRNSSLSCSASEIEGIRSTTKQVTKYWMMTSCPSNYPENDIHKKCTQEAHLMAPDISFHRPVTSYVTAVTYKNIYCSLCNGEERQNTSGWKMFVKSQLDDLAGVSDIEKSDEEIYKFFMQNITDFDIVFEPSKSAKDIVQKCYSEYISTCNVTGVWRNFDQVIMKACENLDFISVFTDCNKLYKNVYCAICNTQRPYQNLSYECPGSIQEYARNKDNDSVNVHFSSHNPKPFPHKYSVKCDPGEIYDPKKRSCLKTVCELGFRQIGPKCEVKIKEANEATYVLNTLTCSDGIPILSYFKRLPIEDNEYVCSICGTEQHFPVKKTEWKKCQPLSIWYKVSHPHRVDFMMEYLYNLHRGRTYVNKENYTMYTAFHPNMTAYVNSPRFLNPFSMIQFPIDRCLECSKSRALTFSLAKWQTCPRVLVETFRMYILHDKLLFCFKEYDACISHSYVRVSDDLQFIGVCIHQYLQAIRNTYTGVKEDTRGETVFIICLLISLLACLLHSISTVFLIEEWTPLILCQMAQSFSYFALNFFLILTKLVFLGEIFCAVFGMVIHFLFLLVAGWSSVVCVDLARAIHMLLSSGVRIKMRLSRFVTYAAINFTVCLLFVIFNAFIINDYENDSFLGYSLSGCEISSINMSLYTIGIPLSCMFAVNSACIFYISFKIKGIFTLMHCPEITMVKSFSAISFFVWLCWVFDYIVALTNIAIFGSLRQLATVVNGIVIFVAFSPVFFEE